MRQFLVPAAMILLALSGGTVAAHPHVWITARSEVVFGDTGELIGFRHIWTFDRAYSAFAVQGFDSNGDNKPDPDKLADLAKTNVESLAEFDWFTTVKIDNRKAECKGRTNSRPLRRSKTRPVAAGSLNDEGARSGAFIIRRGS